MHRILYDNAQSDWNEALPMGNGVFGGMSYFRENRYTIALNHYEVYYSIHERYSRNYQEKLQKGEISFAQAPNTYEGYLKTAAENTRDYTKEAYLHYRKTIWPDADTVKEMPLQRGVSQIPTGELSFSLDDIFEQADDYKLALDIERATTSLTAQKNDKTLTIDTIALTDCDAILSSVKQSAAGCVRELALTFPLRRNQEGVTYEFHRADDKTFYGLFSFYPHGEDRKRFEPFRFLVAIRLIGAAGEAQIHQNSMRLRLKADGREYYVLTYVLTELQSDHLVEDALQRIQKIAERLPRHVAAHRSDWQSFFQKSSVTLPDKFLEKLWYYNLYILNCCSGKNGRRREQASGLNGLWDIRQPTIWGSLWYWDINIQATYWPVYTANHLELAEVFNEGFLSYADFAARRAREFYHARGYAIDYPFEFYHCIWPWCAQFLWWYYEYTQDTAFLREKAYPMFQKQIEFIRDIIQYDKETGTYFFFPDVSPEQGPITRNSTITIAAVKYLLEMAMKANQILNESSREYDSFKELLSKLPKYPVALAEPYGEIFKDSEYAPPGIKLRHPSLLMPIFPIGEITRDSEESVRRIAENTVRFASENTEIGVFPFGWISAAAARLGKGNLALRVLYEQGLDLILRANGMGAEETDRWLNHCVVDAGPLYYPCMMECVGEIVSCVDEMLMQSVDGEIVLFPAVPDGTDDKAQGAYRQIPLVEPEEKKGPVVWKDCSFDKLLAKGGFEVSAVRQNGKVRSVKIKSLYGNPVKVRTPDGFDSFQVTCKEEPVPVQMENGALCFQTRKNSEYWIVEQRQEHPWREGPPPQAKRDVFFYVSHLGRRVFAGKDRNTDVIKLLDSFLFDSYVANDRCHPIVPYCFSFGLEKEKQVPMKINSVYELQQGVEKRFLKISPSVRYTDQLGFGFCGEGAIRPVDTAATDCLLRDSVAGEEKAIFKVELPKGSYEILVVSGGTQEQSVTEVTLKGGNAVLLPAKPGEYKADVLFVQHKACGPLAFEIAAACGECWNLNLLIVRKLSSLM